MATASPPDTKLLTFRAGVFHLTLAIEGVREVMRMPRLSRVPHAPPGMLGLANLRGTVIPVLSAADLLGSGNSTPTRLIVVDHGELLGLAVDDASQVLSSQDTGPDTGTARALNLAELVARGMPGRAPRQRQETSTAPLRDISGVATARALVAFAIGEQEFALPAEAVDTVLPLPAEIVVLPDADDVVIGTAAVGGTLLPLLSLRALLSLPVAEPAARPRVVVARIGSRQVGLMVDAMRGVLHVPDSLIDPIPHALRRGHAEARIQAICRLDDGVRLVSVLAADQLLRADITATLLVETDAEPERMTDSDLDATEQFLIFRIGAEEFGIPVASVEEVALLPARLTRMPRAPAFVQGVMNLRGQVIPVIDQGQRFGAQPSTASRRRVIVVRIGALQAGFVVDAVSDVARVDVSAIRTAPDLGNNETHIFDRVANLADEQRIILIISPRELLDRAEQDLLLGLGKKGSKAGS